MKQGRVIINRNICDNAPECSGIEVCPVGAIFWDKDSETIAYDADRCLDCGSCADPNAGGCPVGAILWGEDDDDYEQKRKEVEDDTRTLEELEVERYGAVPIMPVLEYDEIEDLLVDAGEKYVLIEFFNDASINCLIHSIEVENILHLFDGKAIYKKVQLESAEDCKSLCKIEDLPALAVFRYGKNICVINGYYENDDESCAEFFKLIRKSVD